MPSPLDFPARGKILRVEGNVVVFNPTGTTYELHLASAGGPLPTPSQAAVSCHIRADARKIWTMSSGGNFVTPIIGPPRVVQGRVRYLDERTAVVQAGVPVVLTLPALPSAYDLERGPIEPGAIVNATLLAGATIELAKVGAAVSGAPA